MNDKSTLYLAFAVVVGVAAGVLMFYVASYPYAPRYTTWPVPRNATMNAQPLAVQQNQLPPLNSGNSVSNIANDLNQIPDDSAALNQDLNSLGTDIKNF